MGCASVEMSTIRYNAAISACEKGGKWQKALALRSTMGQASGEMRTISYNAAFSACEIGGEWQRAPAGSRRGCRLQNVRASRS
jgi:pentatricopeptide repeat domain-containing protein 1